MTKTIEQARREAFEAGMAKALIDAGYDQELIPSLLSRGSNGDYQTIRVDGAWDGYNAALDSLCIELPHDVMHVTNKAYEEGRDDVLKAIHAAGVKTR